MGISLNDLALASISPVLLEFLDEMGDRLDEAQHKKLTRLAPRLLGTDGDGKDDARRLLALDWMIRVYTPAWLRLVPEHVVDADLLAQLPPVTNVESVLSTGAAVGAAALRIHNAKRVEEDNWDSMCGSWQSDGSAWGAARNTAFDVAWNAAASVGDDAMDVAWPVDRGVTRNAWNAARDAAWLAAWSAAKGAVWDALLDVPLDQTAAKNAAGNAAREALAPTVAALQESLVDLCERMVEADLSAA